MGPPHPRPDARPHLTPDTRSQVAADTRSQQMGADGRHDSSSGAPMGSISLGHMGHNTLGASGAAPAAQDARLLSSISLGLPSVGPAAAAVGTGLELMSSTPFPSLGLPSEPSMGLSLAPLKADVRAPGGPSGCVGLLGLLKTT